MKTYVITEPKGHWNDYIYRFFTPLDGIDRLIFKNRTAKTSSFIVAEYFRKLNRYTVEVVDL